MLCRKIEPYAIKLVLTADCITKGVVSQSSDSPTVLMSFGLELNSKLCITISNTKLHDTKIFLVQLIVDFSEPLNKYISN